MSHHPRYWKSVAVMCLTLLVITFFLGGNLFALPCAVRCRNERCVKVPVETYPTKPCVKYSVDWCGIVIPTWRTNKASQGTCTEVLNKTVDIYRCKDCTAECPTPSVAAGCATGCEFILTLPQYICKTGT